MPKRPSDLLSNEEFFRQEIWGHCACTFCNGRPVVIEGRASLPESKLLLQDAVGFLAGKYGSGIRFKDRISSEMFYTVEVAYACEKCKAGMERGFAHKYGDSAYILFDRGATDSMIIDVGAARLQG